MTSTTQLRWIRFCGHDIRCNIWAKVDDETTEEVQEHEHLRARLIKYRSSGKEDNTAKHEGKAL